MARPFFIRLLVFLAAAVVFSACNAQKQVELEVRLKISLDGKPVPGAQIAIDQVPAGQSDAQGLFVSRLQKLPGQEVALSVSAQAAGYHLDPWEQRFVAKLADSGVVEIYPFDVKLAGKRYFTLSIMDGNEAVADAEVAIEGKQSGQSDALGDYIHTYENEPDKGFAIRVAKKGYRNWEKRVRINPGDRYPVNLKKKTTAAKGDADGARENTAAEAAAEPKKAPSSATLTLSALTDAYGVSRALPDVLVSINGKPAGKTDGNGKLVYRTKSLAGRKVELNLQAPGYIPEQWRTNVTLTGRKNLRRYFYPARPPAISVGLYGYTNNTPDADLGAILASVEEAVRTQLFQHQSFREVPKQQLRGLMRQNNLNMETISTKGWGHTKMVDSVDMLVSGSVSQTGQGYAIETTVTTVEGKTLLSQLNTARKSSEIQRTARLIVTGIMDQFPFEGTVAAVEEDGYRINLGTRNYNIRRGNQFRHMHADMDSRGRIKSYSEQGLLRIVKTDALNAWAQAVGPKKKQTIQVGDKIIRRIYLDEEREAAKATLAVTTAGGSAGAANPLWGVNVYLNNTWMGTTAANGRVEIPVRLNDRYDILLSRHGYQQLTADVDIDAKQVSRQYTLEMANAVFKAESEPSNADVFIDGILVGKTPLLDGKLVNFGFRKVRLSLGGEYRDWEQVVEFNQPEVSLTGARRIVLLKDWYNLGEKAEQGGRIDDAIQAFSSVERQNPDYAKARHRLARLYMDGKNDYDAAIREFENVLALPENQQVIYKQYAIAYTNLGHAYYEKGNQQIWSDKQTAAENFAKAIEKLKVAKQNTRFFPNEQFNEALHDTYYYLAISYHKLYLVTQQQLLLPRTNQAWRDYFDFFPKQLEGQETFEGIRDAARNYWQQIKDMS